MNQALPLMRFLHITIFSLVTLFTISSCGSEKETFDTPAMSDYLPMQVGKYIIYRMDSTVFTNLNTTIEVHKYQVRHHVSSVTTDNAGRTTYIVNRSIRNEAGTSGWQANGNYTVVTAGDQTEVVDDNLRVIKLHIPLREGFSWKGNRHLPLEPYKNVYTFSADNDMQNWDFYYDSFGSFNHEGNNYEDVLTVEQVDESDNLPIQTNTTIATRIRSVDRYAKNIGLVFKEYTLWEYQNNPSSPNPTYTGFGVTMWMIEHN